MTTTIDTYADRLLGFTNPRVTERTWEAVLTHWERLILNPWFDEPSSWNCALCNSTRLPTIYPPAVDCSRCPVAAVTGIDHCDGTPYDVVVNWWSLLTNGDPQTLDVYRYAAWRELRFLVRLHRAWQRTGGAR